MIRNITTILLLTTLISTSVFAGNIVETAQNAGKFNTLLTAAKAAGLAEALQGEGPFTVFAPTDAAFAKLPKGTIPALLKNTDALKAILTYHVVAGDIRAKDVVSKNGQGVATLNGQELLVTVAKSDKATQVKVDGANVVATDIVCSNGVIHVIDSVITPQDKNIVTTAVGAGAFKTLVTAVKAAGLVEALSGKGPLTVFAPTDAAFANLPEGTIPALLKDKAKLTSVLTFHVVAGNALAGELSDGQKLKTLNGKELTVSIKDGKVSINGANVSSANVRCSNGVIHIIDSVMLP